MDGIKGKTWGPSSVQRDRHHRASWVFGEGRWSKSAPNLEKSLKHIGGHSNIGALQELGEWSLRKFSIFKPRENLCATSLFLCLRHVPDYEEDEWPEFPGDPKSASYNSYNGNATEMGPALRRLLFRRPSATTSTLCNMTVILASVAAGFDIRTANYTAIQPRAGASEEQQPDMVVSPLYMTGGPAAGVSGSGAPVPASRSVWNHTGTASSAPTYNSRDTSFIGNRRDAYLSAVRDNFISPGSDFHEVYTSATGYPHNTYHGTQTKYRPSVNFDVPMRFAEAVDPFSNSSGAAATSRHSTPGHPADTTTSTTGSVSPRKSSLLSECDDMALISLSPSQDKAFTEYQRQLSDTSSSVFETPKTTPKTTPQRYNVKFEDALRQSPSYSHRRSPSNTSSISYPFHDARNFTSPTDGDIPVIKPPPRRQNSSSSEVTVHGTPERPVTLDIIPRPRPHASILKRTSPVHIASRSSPGRTSRITPTPSDSMSTGADDASYVSARSAPSPGSTPPHIEHMRTLLDIDMEGQKADGTAPISATNPPKRHPTINELEREFLYEL